MTDTRNLNGNDGNNKTETAANIAELKGRLSAAREAGKTTAIIKIPVYLLAIDERYQTPIRTERLLSYLTSNWDENKLLPLQGVPHDEEGKIYLTDGYGRWKASQIVDKEKYTSLDVLVILNAPADSKERLKFEAEQFAFQNKNIAPLKPIQKHGAMEILGDTSVLSLNDFRDKYGFEYSYSQGSKRENTLGSYSEVLNIIRTKGTDCMDFIFNIITRAGFNRKTNGYSKNILRALRDAYCLYNNDATEVKRFLISVLRSVSPRNLNAQAIAKYPTLAQGSALSLYIEDLIVNNLHLEQSRDVLSKEQHKGNGNRYHSIKQQAQGGK